MDLLTLISGKSVNGLNFSDCPFCHASNMAYNDKEFACFSCGKYGDTADYLSEKNHVSRTQALWQLTKESNEDLMELLQVAANYFISRKNNLCYKYLKERKITAEMAEKFQIGWADGTFIRYLEKNGYDKITAQRAGLIKPKGCDSFYNRLMFPIMNRNGKVVGFGGRRVLDSDTSPKYLNSPESKVFQKRECLFGIQNMDISQPVFIVEGYMDALSLQAKGINAVAVLGTAVGSGHAHLLRSLNVKDIILSLDGDEAGVKNALKGIAALKEFNVEILCNYQDSKDPDEFVNKHGAAAFNNLPRMSVNKFLLKSGIDLIDIL